MAVNRNTGLVSDCNVIETQSILGLMFSIGKSLTCVLCFDILELQERESDKYTVHLNKSV